MGWIRCVRCKKLQRDFMGRTFVLIAPVQYALHQLSCTYETIPNAPKYYETHRNISLGSNGVRSLRKITTRLCGTNICINCTNLVCFATSFIQLRKRSQMRPNTTRCTKTLVQGPMGWIGCFCCDFVARSFAIIALVHLVLHRLSCSYEMIPNAPKYCETDQNISLESNRVDWLRSLRKIPS